MAMAGRQRRADRLNERLRGAQRANVGDESFSLNIEGLDPSSAAVPRTPSASARKRKRDDNTRREGASLERANALPKFTPPPARDPYGLPDASKESPGRTVTRVTRGRASGVQGTSSSRSVTSSSRTTASVFARPGDRDADELEALPVPRSVRSPTRRPIPPAILEEIEESPLHAPGSGRRRKVPLIEAISSATRLQNAVHTDGSVPQSSSPLVQKVRRSGAAKSVPSGGPMGAVSRRPTDEDADELSPDRPRDLPTDPKPGSSGQAQREEAEYSEEYAEEVGVMEAAKALRKTRPRRSMRTRSPELGSGSLEAEQDGVEPAPGRHRRRPTTSPAVQKKAVRKPRPRAQKQPPREQEKGKGKPSSAPKKAAASRRASGHGDDDTIQVTVQRFINNKGQNGDDSSDPLHSEIPFANRSGESVIDVLAQVCQEAIAATLDQLEQLADKAGNGAKKKECRIKMRAIVAYREELSSRLLQHAIHLNHWHSLRKQVRRAQAEKLSLRDEILRLRGEREQVALRMDAVRIKHETESRASMHRINTSTLMHDVDLAIEQGLEAPDQPRAAHKEAELGKLELLIARVSEEASSASSTGGMLRQVKDLNDLLERAALALESR